MRIRNYTSSVAVERSQSRIEALLVKAGATTVSKFYGDRRNVAGFFFQIPVNGIPITFRLPSNPDSVRKAMMSEVKRARQDTHRRIEMQAERTAWRLLEEWVHIQLSMIQMQQADAMQVFLPYAYNGSTDKTFYEQLKGTGFKQLGCGKDASQPNNPTAHRINSRADPTGG